MKMPTGPNHEDFKGPKFIASGHFHKRQIYQNVVYIGNTFPMDFGDAGDFERGMMTFDHESEEMLFENWEEGPRYIKTTLSDILDNTVTLYPDARIKCICDIPGITFEESSYLRQKFTEDYDLREFVLEESSQIKEAMTGDAEEVDWDDDKLASTDELVHQMLMGIESEHIDNGILTDIYKELKVGH